MKKIFIEKITLNVGAGKDESKLNKGIKLISKLTDVKTVKTTTQKRIPGWGLRPGLAIGVKATIRKDCNALLERLLKAKDMELSESSFDNYGNFSFGVSEYIDIEGLEYDPELKIMGLEVAVTLSRPGYRVQKRKYQKAKVGSKHRLTKEDSVSFMKEMGVKIQ